MTNSEAAADVEASSLRGLGMGLPDPVGGNKGTFGFAFSRSLVSVAPSGVTKPTVAGTEEGVNTAGSGVLLGELSDIVRARVRGRGTGLETNGFGAPDGNSSLRSSSPGDVLRLRGRNSLSSGHKRLKLSGCLSDVEATSFREVSSRCCRSFSCCFNLSFSSLASRSLALLGGVPSSAFSALVSLELQEA